MLQLSAPGRRVLNPVAPGMTRGLNPLEKHSRLLPGARADGRPPLSETV